MTVTPRKAGVQSPVKKAGAAWAKARRRKAKKETGMKSDKSDKAVVRVGSARGFVLEGNTSASL
jgi:hypothetical protein